MYKKLEALIIWQFLDVKIKVFQTQDLLPGQVGGRAGQGETHGEDFEEIIMKEECPIRR